MCHEIRNYRTKLLLKLMDMENKSTFENDINVKRFFGFKHFNAFFIKQDIISFNRFTSQVNGS